MALLIDEAIASHHFRNKTSYFIVRSAIFGIIADTDSSTLLPYGINHNSVRTAACINIQAAIEKFY